MSKKKVWDYICSSNVIWADFDYGTVEADTYAEAVKLSKAKISEKLNLVNSKLNGLAEIGMDLEEIVVELSKTEN